MHITTSSESSLFFRTLALKISLAYVDEYFLVDAHYARSESMQPIYIYITVIGESRN